MFRYIDNKDRTFLFGAYRGEKSQLEWILGKQPHRYEKLYNIRFNKDLFSQRRGGVMSGAMEQNPPSSRRQTSGDKTQPV